jgi:hypothetical protein
MNGSSWGWATGHQNSQQTHLGRIISTPWNAKHLQATIYVTPLYFSSCFQELEKLGHPLMQSSVGLVARGRALRKKLTATDAETARQVTESFQQLLTHVQSHQAALASQTRSRAREVEQFDVGVAPMAVPKAKGEVYGAAVYSSATESDEAWVDFIVMISVSFDN